jgi:hypothetical protein
LHWCNLQLWNVSKVPEVARYQSEVVFNGGGRDDGIKSSPIWALAL